MDSTAHGASIALNNKLQQLSQENAECTIYRVYRELRRVNPKTYEPEVIAIGPYHRKKPHLKMMEDHKLRNLQSLVKQDRCDVKECAEAMGELESEARKCYADQRSISLNSKEFVEMLVLDGCFIVEIIRKYYHGFSSEDDSIFQMEWMSLRLGRDLMLFENQIPFFVLSKLYDLIMRPFQDTTLSHLLFIYFIDLYPGDQKLVIPEPILGPGDENTIKHLLDFVHRSWVPPQNPRDNEENSLELVKFNATGLTEANVQFKNKVEGAATLFDIEFKDGVLLMPCVYIYDYTECVLRNLVVYEQYFKHTPHNFVTDYVLFLDCLIDSPKDVELLLRNEILINSMGDEEAVAKMVNMLGDSIVYSANGLYAGIAKDLNEHCRKPRNRWMAKLRQNYLNSPWAVISIIVAIVLLLLTVTQTVFSILQVVLRN